MLLAKRYPSALHFQQIHLLSKTDLWNKNTTAASVIFLEERDISMRARVGSDRREDELPRRLSDLPRLNKACPRWQEPDNLSVEKGWISIRVQTYHSRLEKMERTGCVAWVTALPAGLTKCFPLFPGAGRRRSLMNEWCNVPSGGRGGGPALLAIAGNSWSHLWAYDLAASAIWRRLGVISATFPTRDWWFNYGYICIIVCMQHPSGGTAPDLLCKNALFKKREKKTKKKL